MIEVVEIDIGPLEEGGKRAARVGAELDAACRELGFFYIVGHGIDPALPVRLDALSREFFSQPETEKARIAMWRGGRSWRGWFPVGGELTSGVPDEKEGIYFGTDLGPKDQRVRAGIPLHGLNLYPRRPSGLESAVRDYISAVTRVGQLVLSGLALGLGLEPSWFVDHLTAEPLVLFRIFHYPPAAAGAGEGWGVGEHTDYGLLTVLGQDDLGGLEVRTPSGWVEASPRPGAFVCNLGDMLERLTGGRYRSTPHRVRNVSGEDRLSFPLFLDPSWEATVERLPIVARPTGDDAARRWDHSSVHGYQGTYGDYILGKVGRVLPDLAGTVLPDS
jgi:isopenicillin N synthase-like dioxygenase